MPSYTLKLQLDDHLTKLLYSLKRNVDAEKDLNDFLSFLMTILLTEYKDVVEKIYEKYSSGSDYSDSSQL